MYLKLTTMIALFLTFFTAGEAQENLHLTLTRISFDSLVKHPCKDYISCIEDYKNQPLILAHLENFPKEGQLSLYVARPLAKNKSAKLYKIYDFQVEQLIDDYIYLPSCLFLPGERIEIIIVSQDKKELYSQEFIPNEIRGKNEKGEVLFTAELKILNSLTSYIISLDGFEEDEEVMFKSMSGHEVIEHPIVCNIKAAILYLPGVKTNKGGVGKLSLTRKNGEVISINLPWGNELNKYSSGNVVFDSED